MDEDYFFFLDTSPRYFEAQIRALPHIPQWVFGRWSARRPYPLWHIKVMRRHRAQYNVKHAENMKALGYA